MERAVGKIEKLEFFKLKSLKLESFHLSWQIFNAVLTNRTFSNFGSNFPTSFFPISFRTFQLKIFQLLVVSNCPFQLHVPFSFLFISCWTLVLLVFPSVLSNYTHPLISISNKALSGTEQNSKNFQKLHY